MVGSKGKRAHRRAPRARPGRQSSYEPLSIPDELTKIDGLHAKFLARTGMPPERILSSAEILTVLNVPPEGKSAAFDAAIDMAVKQLQTLFSRLVEIDRQRGSVQGGTDR